MYDPQLPFSFQPIPIKYLETAKSNGKVIGYNSNLKHLWHILLLGGGWGDAITQPLLADLLYEIAPTTAHQNEKGSENPTRNKGLRRFEDILRGKIPVSLQEAEAFHLAFNSVFGPEWSLRVSKERLVMMSPEELFSHFSSLGLTWPPSLFSVSGLQALLKILPNQGLYISPAFEHVSRAGYAPGSDNERLIGLQDIPIYEPGSRFQLQVDGIAKDDEFCFVFELCPDGLLSEKTNGVFYILPHGFFQCDGRNLTVNAKGVPFRMGSAKGRFEFVALTVKSEATLLSDFFTDGDDKPFDLTRTESFVESLSKQILSHSQLCRIARHSYQVL